MSKQRLLSEKHSLKAVSDSITVNRYDNGWMVEICGRDADNDWVTTKTVCVEEEQVFNLIRSWNKMKVDK